MSIFSWRSAAGLAAAHSFDRRFLGSRAVRLNRVRVTGAPAVLGLSSRAWLNYTHQGMLSFAPLIYDTLDSATSFSAELCPEGLIGIVGNSLR